MHHSFLYSQGSGNSNIWSENISNWLILKQCRQRPSLTLDRKGNMKSYKMYTYTMLYLCAHIYMTALFYFQDDLTHALNILVTQKNNNIILTCDGSPRDAKLISNMKSNQKTNHLPKFSVSFFLSFLLFRLTTTSSKTQINSILSQGKSAKVNPYGSFWG